MQHIRIIASLLFAMLILAASSSFYVGVHVCQGEVKAVALLDEADGCGHKTLPPCHRKMTDNCCDNEQIEHEGSVVQYVQASISISPVFYLISDIILPDFSQAVANASSITPQTATGHPPALYGRNILSLIHILRI